MKNIFAALLLLTGILCSGTAAALDPIDYHSPVEEQRFKALAAEALKSKGQALKLMVRRWIFSPY